MINPIDGTVRHTGAGGEGTFDTAALAHSVRTWFLDQSIAFHCGPIEDGRWMTVLDGFLLPLFASAGARFIHHHAQVWELKIPALNGPPILEPTDVDIPAETENVFLPTEAVHVPIKTMLRLYRRRVARCWVLEPRGWSVHLVEDLLAELILKRKVAPIIRRIAPQFRFDVCAASASMGDRIRCARSGSSAPAHETDDPDSMDRRPHVKHYSFGPTGEDLWSNEIRQDNRLLAASTSERTVDRPLRVVQYIGSLNSGGAERQLCNLAIGLHRRGDDCRVWTTYPSDGGDGHGHYVPLLDEAGVQVKAVRGVTDRPACLESVRWDLLAATPESIRPFITSLAVDLANDPPDLLHCWLDHPNIMGALAGIAARVPAILLSTRNSNPTNFPRLYAPYMDTWYRLIASSKRVHWLANSHTGAQSYAEYVQRSVEQVHVILNGVFAGHFRQKTGDRRRESRKDMGLSQDAPVVAIINRLSEEKQPALALKVISMVRQDLPNLRVLFTGVGPLEDEVRRIIRKRGLEDCVQMLGRVRDVDVVLGAADCLLLTSTLEGCPNVALEAQHLGIPVVATAGGGTVDAVVDGTTGYLCNVDGAVDLAVALRRVLVDHELRDRLGRNGQRFVDECFAIDQMVDLTREVYGVALDTGGPSRRIETPKPQLTNHGTVAPRVESISAVSIASPSRQPEINVLPAASTAVPRA